MVGKTLALFDFDGTMTVKDSLFDFIRFCCGRWKLYAGLVVMSPVLLAFIFKLIKNDVAKQKLLAYFFSGWTVERFNLAGERYAKERIATLLRPKAIERLNWHKAQGHRVIIVSASIDTWLKGFCQSQQIELLSTQMAANDGVIVGKFANANCHGQEKVNRIKAHLSLDDYELIYAYGDSSGDKQMLAIADKPFYKPFE